MCIGGEITFCRESFRLFQNEIQNLRTTKKYKTVYIQNEKKYLEVNG